MPGVRSQTGEHDVIAWTVIPIDVIAWTGIPIDVIVWTVIPIDVIKFSTAAAVYPPCSC